MTNLDLAVILAGGSGTRLGSISQFIPKPLVPINGQPFLSYLLRQLKVQGFKKVLLLLGYKADLIAAYVGDGSQFGLDVECSSTHVDDETGRRVKAASAKIDRPFMLMYCDNYWPLNAARMYAQYKASGARAQVVIYRNEDGLEQNNMRIDKTGRVTLYDKTRQDPESNVLDLGYLIAMPEVLDEIPDGNVSLEAELYPKLIADGALHAYPTDHRFYSTTDMGRVAQTSRCLTRAPSAILDSDAFANLDAAFLGRLQKAEARIFVVDEGSRLDGMRRTQGVVPVARMPAPAENPIGRPAMEAEERGLLRTLVDLQRAQELDLGRTTYFDTTGRYQRVAEWLHMPYENLTDRPTGNEAQLRVDASLLLSAVTL